MPERRREPKASCISLKISVAESHSMGAALDSAFSVRAPVVGIWVVVASVVLVSVPRVSVAGSSAARKSFWKASQRAEAL